MIYIYIIHDNKFETSKSDTKIFLNTVNETKAGEFMFVIELK